MPGRAAFCFASLIALVGGACGGSTDRGRPSAKPGGSGEEPEPCAAAQGYEFQNLVNFEGDSESLAPMTTAVCDPAVSCMANPFYFNYDRAQSNPDPMEEGHRCPNDPMGPPDKVFGCDCIVAVNPGVLSATDPEVGSTLNGTEVMGGRCNESSYALHITATNIAMCYDSNGRLGWGGGLDITFGRSNTSDAGGAAGGDGGETGEPAPTPGVNGFDASPWDGISFWVRKGGAGKSSFIITVSDPGTTTPVCSEVETDADAEKCDAFGVAVTLTEEWTFVPAVFRSMRQKGFGKPSPIGHLDSGNIKKIQFLMSAGDWDFWIDDIGFFRAPR
jgi:hypothetical protein